MTKTETPQTAFWQGTFGREYTERNSAQLEEWNGRYMANYGTTKIAMNQQFIGNLPTDSTRFLEIGCNTGQQLAGLQSMGFTQLYGIELQSYAAERSKDFTRHVNIVQASGFDVPFRDAYFDVVFTSGVLIHIAPIDLPKVMAEMIRCSRRYIWGFEYYTPEITAINYRGHEGYLWKADYAALFMQYFPNQLQLVKQQQYPYISNAEQGNVDCMYLLEKVATG